MLKKKKTRLTGNINTSTLQIHSALQQLLPGEKKEKKKCVRGHT